MDNFLDKNKDFVVAEHASLLGAAGLELLTELFGTPEPEPATTPQNGKVKRNGCGTCSTNQQRVTFAVNVLAYACELARAGVGGSGLLQACSMFPGHGETLSEIA
jgi:hypothetical protein